MQQNFERLARQFKKENLNVLLIGGYALQAFGIFRHTIDVDLLLPDADVPVLKNIMKKEDFGLIAETKNFLRFHREQSPARDIDILLVGKRTFDNLYDSSVSLHIMGGDWKVPQPAHFIALKLHAIKNNPRRESRDIADIVEIMEKTKKVPREKLRTICDKYGPEGVFQRIERYLP